MALREIHPALCGPRIFFADIQKILAKKMTFLVQISKI
jgi:hypothetical protein